MSLVSVNLTKFNSSYSAKVTSVVDLYAYVLHRCIMGTERFSFCSTDVFSFKLVIYSEVMAAGTELTIRNLPVSSAPALLSFKCIALMLFVIFASIVVIASTLSPIWRLSNHSLTSGIRGCAFY